jgi:phosphoribosylformylglycinamidine synthase
LPAPLSLDAALKQLVGCPDLASKRWVWEQYDHLILGNTIVGPGGDAAVVRIDDGPKGLALTADVTPRYCFADPFEGGKQAVAEAWRNITAVGGKPMALTDNLNFGNPEKPEIMGQFVGCLDGIGAACRALDFPIVSGNVSLYNETQGKGILPTPSIGGVGLVADVTKSVGIGFTAAGQKVILLGETEGLLGQSIYLREILGREEGAPPPVDLAAEKRNGDFVRGLIGEGAVVSVHDLSDGGLAVALAEMAMAGRIGAVLAAPGADSPAVWFGEDQARYLLAVAPEKADAVLAQAKSAGVPAALIGETGGEVLKLGAAAPVLVRDLLEAHEGWMPSYMAGGKAA